ncbi:hypothetical protein NUU61_007864 [Penicillium alfredii]|uniref:Uncharacterized protein n=1 Tax=Penicillium alfredii TaxID=1506179 RepID=A0A9W9ERA4_9EURO|nr:uncharacterized protein NUU61_007864 [Penicillium alfredii]KAJ5086557.1 hypothetical protein NUU61_007864 [Penicillium alfredii]
MALITSPVVFNTRSLPWSCRWAWLRVLGAPVFLITVIQIWIYTSRHRDPNPIRTTSPPLHRPGILRPGQYVETEDRSVQDKAVDEGTQKQGEDIDERDNRFYLGGTLTLTSTSREEDPSHPAPLIYDPYPAYNTQEWNRESHGHFQPCLGPRGRNLDHNNPEDMVHVYKGRQTSFPVPRFGSYEALGLDGDVCTDRYSRYGVYGYEEDSEDDVPGFTRPAAVPWDEVDWYQLQASCYERNAGRYKPRNGMNISMQRPLTMPLNEPPSAVHQDQEGQEGQEEKEEMKVKKKPGFASDMRKRFHSRSAVVIRAWHDIQWTPDHCRYLRSLIMELALHSGAEYEVFLLVHVKDDELPIFSDQETLLKLKEAIPSEFRSMALFFNNKLLEAWYPKIPEHSPIFQQHQPIQIFSQLYPNFDYIWQFEMDGRLTGHSYHFLDRAIEFAKKQPRKYLWERNAYFYTPGAHGSWENFTQTVDERLRNVSNNTIWGPIPGTGIQPLGPEPPVPHPDNDSYTWGVGEEADIITFLPIFNPQDTQWTFPDKIWNFESGLETPRRAAVITMGRYSRRLLDLIHHAQATRGLGLVSEMTGVTWALFHGLKAVHVPHPIYVDGLWSPRELARIYNPGTPENVNGGPDSIMNWDDHFHYIMYRLSYMFTSHTGEDLYRRWLGYRTAEQEEAEKRSEETSYGRHCFPSIFLHPVKNGEKIMGPNKAVP